MSITFILGGARSGKSRRAQSLAEAIDGQHIFIATAEAMDAEMAERIARHKADRGEHWRTVEAPLNLAAVISEHANDKTVGLVDCLTLWLSNLLHYERDIESETAALCETLASVRSPLFIVSNETGLGLAPDNALGRRFRDAQGRLNQQIAAIADYVEFMAAGLPMRLKG